MKQYKIHQAYINGNGTIVPAGEYPEDQIDIAEARAKTIVTLTTSNLETKPVENPDAITVKRFNTTSELNPIVISPTVTNSKVNTIKINSAELKVIIDIKYVSKKTAEKVVEERQIRRFSDYADLNKRVPLTFSREWEDITALDFEYVAPTVNKPIVSHT